MTTIRYIGLSTVGAAIIAAVIVYSPEMISAIQRLSSTNKVEEFKSLTVSDESRDMFTYTEQEALFRGLSRDAIDPNSIQVRSLQKTTEGSAFCGEINAKNRLGGYVGFIPFMGAFKGNGAEIAITPRNLWNERRDAVKDIYAKAGCFFNGPNDPRRQAKSLNDQVPLALTPKAPPILNLDISFSRDELFSFDLPKRKPEAFTKYQSVIPEWAHSEKWIYNLDGVAPPMLRFIFRNRSYFAGTVCIPHMCSDNYLVFFSAEDGTHAAAVIRSEKQTHHVAETQTDVDLLEAVNRHFELQKVSK